jgi:TamB, inner membrane protein subunit of TAM complex
MHFTLKNFLKIIGTFILLLICLMVVAYFAIQRTDVQNYITAKVTQQLSNKLGTTVEVQHVQLDFLNHLNVQGVYIADKNKDTLLYAGQIQFYITDWFFIKKQKPVISYIGISDAIVNLNRGKTDSIWNYEFIAAAFAAKPNTDLQPNTTTQNTNQDNDTSLAFDIQKIKLDNIRYNSIDNWVGENLIANVHRLDIDARKIDWKAKWIDLKNININKIKIVYEDYPGGRAPRKKIDTIDTTPFNPGHWRITLNHFQLNNSSFIYDKDFEKPTPHVFDEEHIDLKDLNIGLENLVVNDDTITSKIHQLQATDRCGFKIKDTKADITVSPIHTRLTNLVLQTNNSTIQDYFEMSYNRFPDFYDYIHSVMMTGSFHNSNISFTDIGYFGPEINQLPIKNIIIKSGMAKGTVDNIIATNLNITTGNSSLLGNLSMQGLPDINTTIIELESKNLQTTGAEIIKYIPAANTPNVAWADLRSINFKGKYKGYISDFVTDGNVVTNLGTVSTNIHMTFKPKQQPTYNGYFKTTNLQLGKIIKQNVIGNLSADGQINGSGFDVAHLHTTFNGDVKSIQTKNYTYQNIRIDGAVNQKMFEGKIKSNDQNLALNFNGKIDFGSNNPDFKLKTQLVQFNLQALGITKDPITGSAYMDLDFKGNSIDNFTGNAKLYDLHLSNGSKKIFLDSAILISTPIGLNKKITLRSSAADAELTGQFTIAQLPAAMQYYLSNYLPNYIIRPKNVIPQQFSITAHTKNIEPLLQTFMPNISNCDDITMIGALNMFTKQLNLNVVAPNFSYNAYHFQNIVAQCNGTFDSLLVNGTTGKILMAEQEIIPSADFKTILSNDTAVVSINTAGGAYNVKNASLLAKGFAADSKLFINILPSSFYFNQSKWDLNTDDYVILENEKIIVNNKTGIKNKITIGQLLLKSGLQKLELRSDGANQQNLVATIENIDIEELAKFSKEPLQLQGRINGNVTINNYLTTPAYSGDVTTTEIKYAGDTLGKLMVNVDYDNNNKIITINETSGLLYKNDKTLFSGTINLTDKDPTLALKATLKNTNLKTFEKFFEGFITNTKGLANGDIDVNGKLSNYTLNGAIRLSDVQTKVIYLGTTYSIPYGLITLSEKDINLGKITLIDELKNTAELSGRIYHDHFNDIRFGKEYGVQNQLVVRSNQFQFMNTTALENQLYYGNVIANGAMNLSGPLDNLSMEILCTTLPGSALTLPIRGSYDANQYDFIQYKSYTEDEKAAGKIKKENRLLIKLLIQATPDAKMRILMDPTTGEEIIARGAGNINMDIDLNNDIKMNGTYTIEQGVYGYTFRNIIKKNLTITPGGTVEWTGKPLEAQLNVEANYTTNANVVPLLGAQADDATKEDKINYPTNVIIGLTGQMLTPTIRYDITQPSNTDITSVGYNKLKALKSDDQKLLFQVASLIVTGQFVNTEISNGTGAYTTSAVLNTINGVFASTLSNILSTNFSKLIGAKGLQIDIDYKNNNSINGLVTDQFNYNIKKSYLNNRLEIEIGDNVDYIRGTGTKFTAIPNDFRLKYLINPDGKLSVSIFQTTFTDITSTNPTPKRGVGLSYKKSFNTFSEFWKKPNTIPSNFIGPAVDSIINKGTN